MVSPNWQILSSLKHDFWWHHLISFFLSFQKILKNLTLDPRNSSYGSRKNRRTIDWTGVVEHNYFNSRNFSTVDPMSKILWFIWNRPFKWCVSIQIFFGAIICIFRPWTMVSPNWQILLSLEYEVWWHHLKGLFLSFQKIVDIGSTEFKLWQPKESPNHWLKGCTCMW